MARMNPEGAGRLVERGCMVADIEGLSWSAQFVHSSAKSRNIKTDVYAQYNERSSNFWSCLKEWLLQCRPAARAKKIGLGCLACQEYRFARHDEILLIVEVLAFRLSVALVRGNSHLVFDFVLSPES